MNKKGFTLIEIIAVVAILGLLGVLITVNLNKLLKDTDDKKCTEFISEVEEAACTYASLTKLDSEGNKLYDANGNRILNCNRSDGSCTFSIEKLYEEGMIDSEVNSCNDEKLTNSNGKKVIVSWDSRTGEKICKYQG